MANLKILVSSTCYDLGVVRSKLKEFIWNMGYDPVLSDFSDVLYDPRIHTHTSCVDEVTNCDMLILLIGSRFGGKAVPEAMNRIDFDKINMDNRSSWLSEEKYAISITQLEVLKAIEESIPIFSFVNSNVMHDHLVYEKNKHGDHIDKISFPSIDKPETAKYIFEFINFLRLRSAGNSIVAFSKIEDIESHLKKQWSGLIQRLIREERLNKKMLESSKAIQEQLDDLKSAILSSISAPEAREIARSVLRYKRLIQFIVGLNIDNSREIVMSSEFSWLSILEKNNFKSIVNVVKVSSRKARSRISFVDNNGWVASSRYSLNDIELIISDCDSFSKVKSDIREATYEAWRDNNSTRIFSYAFHTQDYKYEDLEDNLPPGDITIENYDLQLNLEDRKNILIEGEEEYEIPF